MNPVEIKRQNLASPSCQNVVAMTMSNDAERQLQSQNLSKR